MKSKVLKHPRIDIDEVEMVRLYKSGTPLMALADRYNCNVGTIKYRLTRLGLYVPDTQNGAHRRSKHDNIDIDELISLYLDGWTTTKLAKRYNCNYLTVIKKLTASGVYKRKRTK